ncbi:hypothetical protein EYS06_05440 [Escherichia albertii]|uniref:Uncharacterized protein n=1 Tax=Escherichia albertii TaxID=208962 RepID=A0A7Z7YP59_ESCAL|nr:hypothetical protein EYS06_05440 [Escherichia albertii]
MLIFLVIGHWSLVIGHWSFYPSMMINECHNDSAPLHCAQVHITAIPRLHPKSQSPENLPFDT